MQESSPPDATQASRRPARIRRQYHPTTLAVKHGISRAEAQKVLAAAGNSRDKAEEMALTLAGKRAPHAVDQATHGSGNRNADLGVGSDQQKI